jgi:hypothetical protein
MGADFVFSIVPLDRKYDYWKEAIDSVTKSDFNSLLDLAERVNVEYKFEDLDLDDFKEVVDEAFQVVFLGHGSDIGFWSPDGVKSYAITGGMSWGDDPTDAYQYFETCEFFMDWHDRKGIN